MLLDCFIHYLTFTLGSVDRFGAHFQEGCTIPLAALREAREGIFEPKAACC